MGSHAASAGSGLDTAGAPGTAVVHSDAADDDGASSESSLSTDTSTDVTTVRVWMPVRVYSQCPCAI